MEKKIAPEQEREDALSLCDLPNTTAGENEKDDNTHLILPLQEYDDDNDFVFGTLSIEDQPEEMFAADKVFYRGQILPSSSSSISGRVALPPVPPRENRFPSPKPQRFSANNQRTSTFRRDARRTSTASAWSILRLGPPPEVTFKDLKSRYPLKNNVYSQSVNGGHCGDQKKRINRRGFLGGCRCCSTHAVDAVRSKVVVIKRSEGDATEREVSVEQKQQEEILLAEIVN